MGYTIVVICVAFHVFGYKNFSVVVERVTDATEIVVKLVFGSKKFEYVRLSEFGEHVGFQFQVEASYHTWSGSTL